MSCVNMRNGLSLLGIALIIALNTTATWAGNVHWLADYAQAKKTATAESKPMLIMFTASWCGPCKKMKSTTLSDATVESVIEKNFVPVMIDTDADRAVTRKFGITAMPTIMVVDPATEDAEKVRGYVGRSEFLAFLNNNKPDVTLASATKTTEMSNPSTQSAAHETTAASELLTPYCLVTIVKEGKLAEGNPAFTAQHAGLQVRFSTAEKRDLFVQNPSAFFPELQGYCPVTWKDSGKEVRGEARWAVEYDSSLFFCHTREHALQFLKDPARYSTSEVKVGLQQTEKKSAVVN